MYFQDNDDPFDSQLKELLIKKQKKMAKLERLHRKKNLIEEIKQSVQSIPLESQWNLEPNVNELKKGSLEWAYFILRVNKKSDLSEIKKNYLQLAQLYHPDKNKGKDIQEMRDLNEAWDIIKKL